MEGKETKTCHVRKWDMRRAPAVIMGNIRMVLLLMADGLYVQRLEKRECSCNLFIFCKSTVWNLQSNCEIILGKNFCRELALTEIWEKALRLFRLHL